MSISAHTETKIGFIRVDGYFDRFAYAPETFSKCFRSIRHHFASTHAAVVFFQMVKLLRPTVSDYLHRKKKYYFFHKRQTFPSRADASLHKNKSLYQDVLFMLY